LVEKSLLERRQPKVAEAFGKLFQASFAEGALSLKVKELIAMCVGLAVNCPECSKGHAEEALKAGATEDEVAEALGVALTFVGGPIFRRSKAIEEMFRGSE
jgi:AhpD family alkylhydroperoxidase